MAYDPEGMSVLSYANGCTVWHYRSSDAVNSVPFTDNNYFLPASDLLKDGDIILAQDNTGRDRSALRQGGLGEKREALPPSADGACPLPLGRAFPPLRFPSPPLPPSPSPLPLSPNRKEP